MTWSRFLRFGGLGAALVLLVAACSGPTTPLSPPSIELDGQTVELVEWTVASATFDCSSIPFGAPDSVEVRFGVGSTTRGDDVVVVQPVDDWTGDLLIFAHGYRDPEAPVGFWDALPGSLDELTAALAAGDGGSGTAAILPSIVCPLSLTFPKPIDKPAVAFAASSYSGNGFALDVAPFDTRAASAWFDELLEAPLRRYLVGASLGGAVTLQIAEHAPGAFDGALATCGPVAGVLPQIDYLGHAELAFRTLYPDAFDGGTAPTTLDDAVDELGGGERMSRSEVRARIEAALTLEGGGIDDTLGGYSVTYADGTVRDLIPYDASDGEETLIDAFDAVFFFATVGKRDIAARTGGVPFDNQDVVYRDGSGSDVSTLAPIVADGGVRAAAAELFSPTGDPGMPLRLIHNERDPVVPAFHSEAYLASVDPGASDVTLEIVRDDSVFAPFGSASLGHCAFQGETLVAFDELTRD